MRTRVIHVGERCPGCGVTCASLNGEHLDGCPYQGGNALRLVAPELDADAFAPRTPAERYRIYGLLGGKLKLIATTPEPEGIGTVLVQLDEDCRMAALEQGRSDGCLADYGLIGVNDGMERRWILDPFRRPL